ncbi:MerR family DNA-binding transcriptional regulator [Paenibacillus sp. A14]|uniref:MerR family DNA-binding transcriptional regulator n=1 Tax=Paenibacillus sp. A14 TaxID=3119820 RepID=UPI002FE3F2DE
MDEIYTPLQAAHALKVSTTTLRRYEDQGLIPDVPRTPSNRRCYSPVHIQAFTAIRALLRGFEIPVVFEVMRKIKHGNVDPALWLVNQQLYRLQMEKHRVEEIMSMIRNADFTKYNNVKVTDAMTIGEVAEIAGVNPSAIRHWEQEGLIASKRNKENGYRIFTTAELRKIIAISSLRKTIYYIENMKQLLYELETQDFARVERSFQFALQKLNSHLTLAFQGISELMKYISFYRA